LIRPAFVGRPELFEGEVGDVFKSILPVRIIGIKGKTLPALPPTASFGIAFVTSTLNGTCEPMATPEVQDQQRHRGYVEQAKIKSEQARLDLERHIAEHGCDYLRAASHGKHATTLNI
jgi:hypothetical protein